jgi:hypothetical protein
MDPTGATKPSARYDIVRATFGHSKGKLVHTVTVAGDVPNPASSAEVPMLFIEDPENPNNSSQCRYFIGRHDGQLGVFTCGYAERVASARITRTSSNTIRFEFKPSAIDNPASYQWAAQTKGPSEGTSAYLDRLPSFDEDFLTHKLR